MRISNLIYSAGWTLCLAASCAASDAPADRDLMTGWKDAAPGTVYQWKSRVKVNRADEASDESLRYTWAVPEGLAPGKPRPVVVLIHGEEKDYSWGHRAFPPGSLRKDSISVSLDGTTERGDGTRGFFMRMEDAIGVRDFALELSRKVPVGPIVLCGFGKGGQFATVFAGRFPALGNGIVSYGGGAAARAAIKGGIVGIPLVFMHGTGDRLMPIAQSVDARDAYVETDHHLTTLRIVPDADEVPPAGYVAQAVDFCLGMTTPDAQAALDAAERLLSVRPPDAAGDDSAENGKPTPPAISMAMAIVRRFDLRPEPPKPPDPDRPPGGYMGPKAYPVAFATATDAQRSKAFDLAVRAERLATVLLLPVIALAPTIEALAALQAPLSTDTPAPARAEAISASGKAIARCFLMREELRGTAACESWAQAIDLDAALMKNTLAGEAAMDTWFADPPPEKTVAALLADVRTWSGYHSVPSDLLMKIKRWCASKDSMVPAADRQRVAEIEAAANAFALAAKAHRDALAELK